MYVKVYKYQTWKNNANYLVYSNICELQKIVIHVFIIFCASFIVISRISKIVHNFASKISLFLPRKTLFSFYRSSDFSFQKTATPTQLVPWSSFDLSIYITRLAQYFLNFSSAIFFSGSSLDWKLASPFLRLIGKLSLVRFWSEKLNNQRAYCFWR